MGAILGLHLAARNPGKVQGVSLFSPTLWINGWAMPWYTKLFKLVRSRWFANFMTFPDAESLGIKCPRVRSFVKRLSTPSRAPSYGRAGVPATMVLEHRRMVDAAMKLLHRVKQPTLIVHSLQDDYANINNAHYLQGEIAGNVDMVVLEGQLPHGHPRQAASGGRRPHPRFRRPASSRKSAQHRCRRPCRSPPNLTSSPGRTPSRS